jgi:hypothetical protein
MKRLQWASVLGFACIAGLPAVALTATAATGASANNATKAANSAKSTPLRMPAALLNKAVSQQMLAERITRTYCMIGQGVLAERAKHQQDSDMRKFEQQLKELQTTATTAEIRDNYALLEQLWDDFKAINSKKATQEQAKQLAELNEELAWIAEKGATLLQEHIRLPRSEAIVLAGRARTLTQRMAKLYFFRSWGLRAEVIAKDLKTAEAEYLATMRRLVTLPQNNAASRQELALTDQQWLFFSEALAKLGTREERGVHMDNVAKISDNLLVTLDQLGMIFEESGR